MRTEQTAGRYDVVVIGDVFCDIATMPIEDFPERDKQIGCDFILKIGGQAGNCAAACASLGLKTALMCKTGNDVLAQWVLSELQNVGVNCFSRLAEKEALQRPGITVSIAFEDGSRSMLTDRGANVTLKEVDVNVELLRQARFVMRAGHWNTEGLFPVNKRLFKVAQSAGAYTGVDIGWSAYLGWTAPARETVFDLLPSTEFLFVNEAELQGLSGKRGRIGARDLLDKGCKNVIIHRGAQGSSWVTNESEISSPAFSIEPINPTGGGDVFNAGFIYAVLIGREAEDCLRFANACAAAYISAKRMKNPFPALKEVENLYKSM
jgi:sugar/nucleoside kinase (ribokinase family)